ncbi:MAG: hypothetical protein ACMUHY_04755, partial [Thermoplasmatota archaeon]
KVVAAALRRPESKRRADFEDLAALTGAQVLSPEAGSSLGRLKFTDMGMMVNCPYCDQAYAMEESPKW